jgi:RimJ/RimL family protein N-acetyltransferase
VSQNFTDLHTRATSTDESAEGIFAMENQSVLSPLSSVLTGPPPIAWRDALPTLVGERAVLRELASADAVTLAPILSAPEVARFVSPPPATAEQFSWFIEWSRRERSAGRYAAFAILPRGRSSPVGLLQVRQLDAAFQTAEWGFVLGSAFWGSGLFADAARLLLTFAFETLGIQRLEARAAVLNARGNAALRKLGASQEGLLRRSLVTADGRELDQVLWALLADEWRSVSARSFRVH